MKVKCPICSSWLTKKSERGYWDFDKITYKLKCLFCAKEYLSGNSFRVTLNDDQETYKSINMSFKFKGYYCHGSINNLRNNNIVIQFYVTEDHSINKINYTKDYSFNDLCDKNIDILDYNEVYWLFKKEARRWAKLQVFS